MKPYRLTVFLQSPPVLNTLTPLDATIAGIIHQHQPGEKPNLKPILEHEPYSEGEAIPLASLPILSGNARRFNVPMKPNLGTALVRSEKMRCAADPKALVMTKGNDHSKAPTYQRGSLQRVVDTYEITWLFTGDGEVIKGLIEQAGAIGAQRSKGYGALDPLRPPVIEELGITGNAERLIGILDEEGMLVRPVPILWAHQHDLTGWISTLTRYSIPYRPAEVTRLGLSQSPIAWPSSHTA